MSRAPVEIAADSPRVQACAAQHFGPWMVEPAWFERAVAAVKAGLWTPLVHPKAAEGDAVKGAAGRVAYLRTQDGIAILSVEGQLTKGESSFSGGTSTVRLRQSIRQAVRDEAVKGILLLVDSPGGTVAGTAELAADVAAGAKVKPTHAHIEDLGASAAFWIASQASRVTAAPTSLVGSIGTVAVVEDSSGQLAKEGVVVHVVSTGPYKGAFTPGSPVTEEQLAYLQSYVDGLNEHFIAGVAAGRRMTADAVRKVADGRVHLAADAARMGLVDAVRDQDQAMADLRTAVAERLVAPGGLAARAEASQEETTMSLKETLSKITAAVEAILRGTAPAAVHPAAAEADEPPVSTVAAVPEAGTGDAPAAAPAVVEAAAPAVVETREAVEARVKADLSKFVTAFGSEKGAEWFSAGKSFEECLALHNAALKADRDRLAAEVQELKDHKRAARGAAEPVSFAPAEAPEDAARAELATKIGPNLARFAAGMKFAKKN